MAKLDVFNLKREKVGELELADEPDPIAEGVGDEQDEAVEIEPGILELRLVQVKVHVAGQAGRGLVAGRGLMIGRTCRVGRVCETHRELSGEAVGPAGARPTLRLLGGNNNV